MLPELKADAPSDPGQCTTLAEVEAIARRVDPSTGKPQYFANAALRHSVEAARVRLFETAESDKARQSAEDAKIAELDRELRAKGLQSAPVQPNEPRAIVPDARALDYLTAWRRSNPNATTAQLATYERDLASIFAGRRWGETPAAFAERQRAEQLAGSELVQGPGDSEIHVPAGYDLEDSEAFGRLTATAESEGISAEVLDEVLQAIVVVANDEPASENLTDQPFTLYDYRFDAAVIGEGFQFDKANRQLMAAARAARLANVSQTQFDALLRSYLSPE